MHQGIADEVDKGWRVDAVGIDFPKVFDLVPHDKLLYEISRTGDDVSAFMN